MPKPDLIILSVKAYDLDEVMAQLDPVLTDRTVILTLQNGVDTEDRLIARLKRDCVVGGVAFIYSKIAAPGVIDHYKKGAVAIGELMGHKSPRLLAIAEIFNQAGIPCQLTDDVRKSKWEKMCWTCVFNPLTVIVDDKVAKTLEHPEMLRVIHQIVRKSRRARHRSRCRYRRTWRRKVERLIQALKAAGKTGFEYKIYQDAPGGHSFNRLDTKLARDSRHEVWTFLARYLKPERPAK